MFFSDFVEVTNLEELIEEGLKLETVQFVSPYKEYDDDNKLLHFLKYYYHKIDCIHGPFKGLDFGANDLDTSNNTYNEYAKFCKFAKELNCNQIVVHCNLGTTVKRFNDKVYYSVKFWNEFLEAYKDMTFYIENVAEKDWTYQMAIIDQVNSDRLKACLDIGHVNVNSDHTVEEWVEALGDRLGHVHLHNNNGLNDQHNGINKGTMEMDEILETLVKHLDTEHWCLETSEVNESLEWLKNTKKYCYD